MINCLVAPAGTGKTHVMAAFARVWAAADRRPGHRPDAQRERGPGHGRGEGHDARRYNIAQFLGKIKDSTDPRAHAGLPGRRPGGRRGQPGLHRGPGPDRRRGPPVRRPGRSASATPSSSGPVDAGGIFRLIAAAARPLEARPRSAGSPRRGSGTPRCGCADGDVMALGRVRRPRPDLPRARRTGSTTTRSTLWLNDYLRRARRPC